MTAIVLTLLLTPAAQISSSAPRGATVPESGDLVGSGSRTSGDVARSVTLAGRGAVQRCPDYRRGLAWYRGRYLSHRERMGAAVLSAPDFSAGESRRAASCPRIRYLASRWRTKAHAARRAYERWAVVHVLRDPEVRPGNDAWEKAVQEAQRAYPNTRDWLLSCSASEGGHGRWVPNSDGAPPGGWLQFYESTFWRMWATAKADVRARGFRLPRSAASWYSPLGQALAGAWALTNGRRHEWAGYGC